MREIFSVKARVFEDPIMPHNFFLEIRARREGSQERGMRLVLHPEDLAVESFYDHIHKVLMYEFKEAFLDKKPKGAIDNG